MKINTVHGNVIVTQPEKEMERLPNSVDALSFENTELLLQNALQDAKIETLEESNADLLLLIAGGI